MRHVVLSIPTCVLFLAFAVSGSAADDLMRPSFDKIRDAVESYYQKQRDRRPGDIISKSDVTGAVDAIEKVGWKIEDQQALLDQVLGDQHVLVASLRSPHGRRFMEKVSGRAGMYDRMDRVSEASGGARLIQDIVKLPDGEKYAKPSSGGGVPDLLDLLPKNSSGKTRRIADYDKPTGRLYTVDELIRRLDQIYREEQTKRRSPERK